MIIPDANKTAIVRRGKLGKRKLNTADARNPHPKSISRDIHVDAHRRKACPALIGRPASTDTLKKPSATIAMAMIWRDDESAWENAAGTALISMLSKRYKAEPAPPSMKLAAAGHLQTVCLAAGIMSIFKEVNLPVYQSSMM
jgi:hypothetical protein